MKRSSPGRNAQGKDSKSFYFTLLLSFLMTAVTSTLLLAFFLTAAYLNAGIRTTREYSQRLLSQTNYAIDQMNENAKRLAMSLLTNKKITAFLSLNAGNQIGTVPVLASQELDNQLITLPYVKNVWLYNSNLDILYFSENGFQYSLEECPDSEIKEFLSGKNTFADYDKRPVPAKTDKNNPSSDYFSYYILEQYTENSEKKNAIIINVNASTLTDSIRSIKQRSSEPDMNFLLLDRNKNYMTGVLSSDFSQNQDWATPVLNVLAEDSTTGSSFLTIKGKRYFQTFTNANENGWYLLNFVPVSLFFQNILSTALIGVLILIGVLGFAFVICIYFTKRLNTPVQSITQLLKKQGITPATYSAGPKEFQMITSALNSLLENNQVLRSLQKKTRYSLTQSCLNNLVTDIQTDAPELLSQKLEHLGLTYLNEQKLCMALIKIDHYRKFLSEHDTDELWALRFSVVNITEEIVSQTFTCNASSLDDDKFVLIIGCGTMESPASPEEKLTEIFHSIQKNISSYLNFTVTIAYSTIFQNTKNFPAVYKNLIHALGLKMQYGHEVIITPQHIDEIRTESFHLSSKMLFPFIDRLIDGQQDEAWSLYENLTQNLFLCDYNEITSTMIHLIYSVYERLTEKYPMLKDSFTSRLKSVLSGLEDAETGNDIQEGMKHFCASVCDSIHKLKQNPANQNTAVTTQKIVQIIQRDYSNPALCLCSIADEIGLSQNYTGHIFKQVMQKSVAQYILDLRMEKLAHYLQTTDLPLNKILDEIGMEKNNYFYTRFKKYFGMSLGEYRQQYRENAAEKSS